MECPLCFCTAPWLLGGCGWGRPVTCQSSDVWSLTCRELGEAPTNRGLVSLRQLIVWRTCSANAVQAGQHTLSACPLGALSVSMLRFATPAQCARSSSRGFRMVRFR